MLSFSQENDSKRIHKRSPIKFMPDLVHGISAEAPQNFQTPYSLISKNSYVNPYLNFEENRIKKIDSEKSKFINPSWVKKVNLQMVEEQKIVNQTEQDRKRSPNSRYSQAYYEQYRKSPNRFKKTRGQCTNFIEKNIHCKDIGPLQGYQRSMDRIKTTKKEVWMRTKTQHSQKKIKDNKQKIYQIQTNEGYKFIRTKHANSTNKNNLNFFEQNKNMTSLSKSKLMGEKLRIRNDREQINEKFKQNLQQRKKNHPFKLQLPKIQSELIPKNNRRLLMKTEHSSPPKDFEQLNQFQISLNKKFK